MYSKQCDFGDKEVIKIGVQTLYTKRTRKEKSESKKRDKTRT